MESIQDTLKRQMTTTAPAATPEPAPAVERLSLPALGADALTDLRAARDKGQVVFFKELPQLPGGCANCGGYGRLQFQYAIAGPFPQPPSTRTGLLTWSSGMWYQVESKSYACPSCTTPEQRLANLWQSSGLELSERNWTLDYIAGMPGKEAALSHARELAQTLPRITSWGCFYGTYGTGKSGILKSLVAACILSEAPARYVRAEDILSEIRSSYGSEEEPSEVEIVRDYGRYQLLAIDEVDRTSTSGWARSNMMRLLDIRYNKRESQATLIATNQHPLDLPAGLEYLASRMKDGVRILVAGDDLRGLP